MTDIAFTLVGGGTVLIALLLWGNERIKKEKEKALILEGLTELVSYTAEQITHFKSPLSKIFSDFENSSLESIGFLPALRDKGADTAIDVISAYLSDEVKSEAERFFKSLGGGYSEGQVSLCTVTHSHLLEHHKRVTEALPSRLRMYRIMPVLLAASVIILFI